MSSSTQTPQQLYEAEKARTKGLDKKIARLEADRENDRQTKEADIERIDSLEVELELKDEELQAKDATIQELQTAFDDADRPRAPGDDKNVEELQAKNRLLEGQIKDLGQKIDQAANGDWRNVAPHLNETITRNARKMSSQIDAFEEELSKANKQLSNANTELASSKEELGELREFNQVLLRELDCLLAEADNQADIQASRSRKFISLAQQVQETNHALISLAEREKIETDSPSKFTNASRLIRIRLGAAIDKAKPFTQGLESKITPTPASMLPSQTAAKRARSPGDIEGVSKGQTAKEGIEKPQDTAGQVVTRARKSKSAPATRGLKQGVHKGLAASSNPFAALADDEKRTTKSAAQAKNSTDNRQPSPSRPIANENAEKRDQKAGSARPVPKEFKYSRAVKPPAAPSFAPKSSRTMAQVAIDPPMLEKPAATNLIEDFLNGTFSDSDESSDSDEPRKKSRISDRKKMQDAAAGNVVEPGKRKPRVPEPKPEAALTPQDLAQAVGREEYEGYAPSSGRRSCWNWEAKPAPQGPKTEPKPATQVIETGKPKSMSPKTEPKPAPQIIETGRPKPMSPKPEPVPLGLGERKSNPLKDLDKSLGKKSERWSDLSDAEEAEHDSLKGHDAASDKDTPKEVASPSRNDKAVVEGTAGISSTPAGNDGNPVASSNPLSGGSDQAAVEGSAVANSTLAIGEGDQTSSKDAGVARDAPAVVEISPGEEVSGKVEHEATGKDATAPPTRQGEEATPAHPAKAETVPSTPAAPGSSLPHGVGSEAKGTLRRRKCSSLIQMLPADPDRKGGKMASSSVRKRHWGRQRLREESLRKSRPSEKSENPNAPAENADWRKNVDDLHEILASNATSVMRNVPPRGRPAYEELADQLPVILSEIRDLESLQKERLDDIRRCHDQWQTALSDRTGELGDLDKRVRGADNKIRQQQSKLDGQMQRMSQSETTFEQRQAEADRTFANTQASTAAAVRALSDLTGEKNHLDNLRRDLEAKEQYQESQTLALSKANAQLDQEVASNKAKERRLARDRKTVGEQQGKLDKWKAYKDHQVASAVAKANEATEKSKRLSRASEGLEVGMQNLCVNILPEKEATIKKLTASRKNLTQEINDLNSKVLSLEDKVRGQITQLRQLDQEKTSLQAVATRATSEAELTKTKLTEAETTTQSLNTAWNDNCLLLKTNDELQAAARNCRSEHSDIEQLRQQVLDLQIQNDELRPCKINFDAAKRLQDLSFSQIKELREHRDEVQQDLSNLKSQMQQDLGIHTTAMASKDQII
ncbi:hypothetical protein HO173_005114 [Letharia columbiana]|uniref:Uncharacterized protein n=1 Tax=Letharia columbiana TaxID=112416 RepID=A0A8H6FXY9_9LECA|nr:uncharacterized protein HO173_005114 [Letharia columbiana]KAF6236823.1 hypothetical protein HO173_005114 [Letharia columbiana]